MTITFASQSATTTVNTTTANSQSAESVAGLASGGYVVVWVSVNQDGSGEGVYLQRFDASGAKVGTEQLANTTTSSDQNKSTVAGLTGGGFVVSWTSQDGSSTGVYAQRYDASGVKVGGEFLVNTTTAGNQLGSSIAGLTNGGFVIGWNSNDFSTGSNRFQIYDPSGVKVGGETLIVTQHGTPESPVLTALAGGGFVATWDSNRTLNFTDAFALDVYAQRFDASGAAQGGETQINTADFSYQDRPSITALPDGGYVIVWESDNQDTFDSWGVYMQRYSSAGAKIGGETLVNTTTADNQTNPRVATLGGGGFVVTWLSRNSVTGNDVYGQAFDSNAAKVGGEIVATNTGLTATPAVAALPGGGFALTWAHLAVDDYLDVFGKTFSALTSGGLTTGIDSANGDGADDVFELTPTTLTSGDNLNGGGGTDTLHAATTGTFDFSGVTLSNIERVGGSAGNDTFVFSGLPPLGMTFDSGGGSDRLIVQGDVNLGTLGLTGTWTVAARAGATSTFILTDVSQIAMVDGQSANLIVDASAVSLSADQRIALFAQGTDEIIQAGGLVFEASGTAEHVSAASRISLTSYSAAPAVAALVGGGYVVAWTTLENNGVFSDLHTQRFNDIGQKLGGEDIVNSFTSTSQFDPSITSLSGGGYVVTWTSGIQGGYDASVRGQIFDAAGAKVGAEFLAGSPVSNGSSNSQVTATANNGFLIAWSSGVSPNYDNVYITRYDSVGAQLGAQIQVNNDTPYFHDYPSVAALSGGGFVVAWLKSNQDGIYLQRYDAAGAAVGSQASTPGSDRNAYSISVTAMKDGGYLLTWQDMVAGVYHAALLSQRYDSAGAAVGSVVQLNTDTANGHLLGAPTVFADGSYLLTWRDNGYPDASVDLGIYIQRFASDGTVQGDARLVSSDGLTTESQVAALANDSYAVVWTTSFNNNADSEIDQRVYVHISYNLLTTGADTIAGTANDTWVVGTPAQINANDSLVGGGGLGVDRLELAAAGTVDLTAIGVFSGFEEISGSSGADVIVTNNARLAGLTMIDGGSGFDRIQLAATGTLDLSAITLTSIEQITGTSGADTIIGSAGNDVIDAGAGADSINGGAGQDTVDYSTASSAVTVDLLGGVAGGYAAGDTFVSVENFTGSAFNDTIYTGAGGNVLIGGAGDDTLDSGAGDDRLDGGDGNDRLYGGAGLDIINGGDGADLIDEIYNDASADVIDAGAGNDDVRIQGWIGSVQGGAGIDTLSVTFGTGAVLSAFSAANGFEIWGGDAAGLGISGTSAADVLDFSSLTAANGAGTLIVRGGAGNDMILGLTGTAAVTLSGEGGNDTLTADAGNDLLLGGIGDDVLNGGDGADTLYGAEDNDQLFGGNGDDLLRGYSGNDLINGGAGIDTAIYDQDGGVTVSLAITTAQNTGGSGFDTLTGIENLTGSGSNDVLSGDAGANVLSGGGGNDLLQGGLGDDTLDGGSGIDTASYSGASAGVSVSLAIVGSQNTLGAGIDNLISIEALIGSGFDDVLAGDSGNNQLSGGVGGVDTVSYAAASAGVAVNLSAIGTQNTVGAGVDMLTGFANLIGSAFDDVLMGTPGGNVLNGGAGIDTVSYANAAAGVTVSLALSGAQSTVAAGVDTLISIENLTGSSFNDTLTGDGGVNVLSGAAGNDLLDGGAGSDNLYGGLGNDTYRTDLASDLVFENAGEGVDTVISTAGYYLYANIENLTLAAGSGSIFGVGNELANVLTGNEGDNLLIAGDGNDNLVGGAGNDALFGQNGDDSLLGQAGIDYLVAGAGNDTLDGGDQADALYGEDGNDLLIGGTGFFTDILVGGNGDDTLNGASGLGDYDLMDGGAGNDTYLVDTPDDLTFEAIGGGTDTVIADIVGAGYYLYANVENLTLQGQTPYGVGNALDNVLTGAAIGNWLLGGAGDDTLNGKGGNDVLFGEAGSDTFVFERGTGGDVIGDFTAGVDRIELVALGLSSFAEVQARMVENGGTTAIDLGQGDFIVINGVAMNTLTANDFIFAATAQGSAAAYVSEARGAYAADTIAMTFEQSDETYSSQVQPPSGLSHSLERDDHLGLVGILQPSSDFSGLS